ncbi:MAG: hypothetical protein ACUVX9_15645 [Anaerolineae bacterium]
MLAVREHGVARRVELRPLFAAQRRDPGAVVPVQPVGELDETLQITTRGDGDDVNARVSAF